MTTQSSKAGEIEVVGPVTAEFAQILTPDAMKFVATLVRTFAGRREELLQKRVQRQAEIDAGKMPDFLPETEHIRQGSWTIAPVPADLQERRVEVTGPSARKMINNPPHSGAQVIITELVDCLSPKLGKRGRGLAHPRRTAKLTHPLPAPEGE